MRIRTPTNGNVDATNGRKRTTRRQTPIRRRRLIGDDVFAHRHLTGRHVGDFAGIAGTGRRIDFEDIDHFVLADGKVVVNTVRYDQMEFARQIKLLPPDGSIADRVMKAVFNAATRVAGIARRR